MELPPYIAVDNPIPSVSTAEPIWPPGGYFAALADKL